MTARNFLLRCIAFELRILNDSIEVRLKNAVYLGKKLPAAIFSVIVNPFLFTDLTNIALGKVTHQAPGYDSMGSPKHAVDGNTNTVFLAGSCSHTGCCVPLPWWRVDFGATAIIYALKITNRACCVERLTSFDIRVGDSDAGRGEQNAACVTNVGFFVEGITKSFFCNQKLYGRYLYVQTNKQYHLMLCEVEVFGEIP